MPSKKRKEKRKSKKGGSVWCTCIMLIHPVKPKNKKRKRGRQHIYSQLDKKFKNEMQAILSKYFWTPFSPIFSPIWEDCVLAGQERNLIGPTKISPIFYPQPNNYKHHFLSTFLYFIFHPPYNHSNQTKPKYLLSRDVRCKIQACQ